MSTLQATINESEGNQLLCKDRPEREHPATIYAKSVSIRSLYPVLVAVRRSEPCVSPEGFSTYIHAGHVLFDMTRPGSEYMYIWRG